MILISGIAVIFAKRQHIKEILFFAMSSGAMLKMITIEEKIKTSRIVSLS